MSSDRERELGEGELARVLALYADLHCGLRAERHPPLREHRSRASSATRTDDPARDEPLRENPPRRTCTPRRRTSGRATTDGAIARPESRYRGKQGEYRWLSWTVSRAADQSCAAVLRDATRRRWIERELEASLSLVEATLESTADGILVVDRSGSVVSFNRRLLRMWGVPDAVVFSGLHPIGPSMRGDACGTGALRSRLAGELGEQRRALHGVLALRDGRVFERYSLPSPDSRRAGGASLELPRHHAARARRARAPRAPQHGDRPRRGGDRPARSGRALRRRQRSLREDHRAHGERDARHAGGFLPAPGRPPPGASLRGTPSRRRRSRRSKSASSGRTARSGSRACSWCGPTLLGRGAISS